MTNLPMLGHTHGNRSAVTCHLKCDSQCARPDPNSSTEPTFAEIAGRQLSRRAVLAGGGALAAAAALPVVWPERAAAAPKPGDARPARVHRDRPGVRRGRHPGRAGGLPVDADPALG